MERKRGVKERSRPGSTPAAPFVRYGIAAILSAVILSGCGGSGPLRDPRVRTDGTTVTVEIAAVEEKGFDFFTYVADSGATVSFFVYRDSSEALRAALDACRKCYRWRRGYTFDGEHVVCRKCGERFEIDTLHEGRGSCAPISLSSTRDGNTLRIPAAELEAGKAYF